MFYWWIIFSFILFAWRKNYPIGLDFIIGDLEIEILRNENLLPLITMILDLTQYGNFNKFKLIMIIENFKIKLLNLLFFYWIYLKWLSNNNL